ncbi:MAG: ferredoxin, partial [Clostridia bacterium]|nr:ferredoxin [Clostridia bacterium]
YNLKVVVITGLANTRKFLDDVVTGKRHYDVFEVMACPSGCVGGAGQPKNINKSAPQRRAMGLLGYDERLNLRYS